MILAPGGKKGSRRPRDEKSTLKELTKRKKKCKHRDVTS